MGAFYKQLNIMKRLQIERWRLTKIPVRENGSCAETLEGHDPP